jgi:hypothetical protein
MRFSIVYFSVGIQKFACELDMCLPTTCKGLEPTYESIGILAEAYREYGQATTHGEPISWSVQLL